MVDVERLKSSVGATLAEEAPIAIGVTALWLPSLVLGVLALKRRRGVGSLVLCSLLVPVLALLVVFPWFPLLHERYVVFLAPCECLTTSQKQSGSS